MVERDVCGPKEVTDVSCDDGTVKYFFVIALLSIIRIRRSVP